MEMQMMENGNAVEIEENSEIKVQVMQPPRDDSHGFYGDETSDDDDEEEVEDTDNGEEDDCNSVTESETYSGSEVEEEESDLQEVVLRTTDKAGVSGFFLRALYRTLYVCEKIGEKLAWSLGITEPRFYDVMLEKEALERYQEKLEDEEQEESDQELQNLEENTTAAMEGIESA